MITLLYVLHLEYLKKVCLSLFLYTICTLDMLTDKNLTIAAYADDIAALSSNGALDLQNYYILMNIMLVNH